MAKNAAHLARQKNFSKGLALSYDCLGFANVTIGNTAAALRDLFQGLKIAEENNLHHVKSRILLTLANIYGTDKRAKTYFNNALKYNDLARDNPNYNLLKNRILLNMGISSQQMNLPDSAAAYYKKAIENTEVNSYLYAPLLAFYGEVLFTTGERQKGLEMVNKSIEINTKEKDYFTGSDAFLIMASLQKSLHQTDSAIYYAQKSLEWSEIINYKINRLKSSELLAVLFKDSDTAKAYDYLSSSYQIWQEIAGPEKMREQQNVIIEEIERQQKVEAEQERSKNRMRIYLLLAILVISSLIAFILFRGNRQKKQANLLLQRQKEEIDNQRNKAEKALSELKSTQAQLIQSKKNGQSGRTYRRHSS